MKLRKKQTYLNSIPEGSPRKRRLVFLAKMLYFVTLITAASYLVFYFVVHYYLYVFATGQVDIEKYYVQTKRDCEIIRYFVDKGQKVRVNQPVVEIGFLQSNDSTKRYLYSEILEGGLDISRGEAKLEVMKKHLAMLEKESERFLLLSHLKKVKSDDYSQLSGKTPSYSDIHREIRDLTLDIRVLEAELGKKKEHQKALSQENAAEANFKFTEVIDSHYAGRINRLCKQPFEYAYKGENLAIIEDPKNIIIKAFFEPQYLNYLYEEKKVKVVFPDGVAGNGIIKKVYSSALQYNSNVLSISKGSIKIMCDIEPADKNETELWKRYIGMELTVRINRSRK